MTPGTVLAEVVVIVGIFYGGRDYEAVLARIFRADEFRGTVEKSDSPLQDRFFRASTPSYMGIPGKIRAS